MANYFFKQKVGYYDNNNSNIFYGSPRSIEFDNEEGYFPLQIERGTAYLLHLQFTSINSSHSISITLQDDLYSQIICNNETFFPVSTDDLSNNYNFSIDIVFIDQEFNNCYLSIEEKDKKKIINPNNIICSLAQINPYQLNENEIKITHLGIQANPFTYIILDGQIVQVGKNGTYEIDEVEIQNFSIAPISPGIFIIDYKYTVGENQLEDDTTSSSEEVPVQGNST